MNNKNSYKNHLRILIMGGTSESIAIIKFIKNTYPSIYVLTTTTTEHGSEIAKEAGANDTVSRSKNNNELTDFIKKYSINLLIDATHPFAVNGTKTGIESSKSSNIKYIRFERPALNLKTLKLKHYQNIYMVQSFDEAGKLIKHKWKDENILHLGGISTTKDIMKHVYKEKLYIRILPLPSSIEKAIKLGLEWRNIIAMGGIFSKNFNKELMNEFNISTIITKESGVEGGVPEKILAADELGIAIILVNRPKVEELKNNTVINDLNGLKINLDKLLNT
jgi:precorrin-6A/cobalt-precorrin-6A reductase